MTIYRTGCGDPAAGGVGASGCSGTPGGVGGVVVCPIVSRLASSSSGEQVKVKVDNMLVFLVFFKLRLQNNI